jgi:hypothetical protein
MTDFERINGPRVEKINAMLDTIDKSAKSQRIGEEDIAALLAPIAQRLNDVEYGDTPVEDEPTPQTPPQRTYGANQNAPRWADMRDMIENATKQECLDALTWIATKLAD